MKKGLSILLSLGFAVGFAQEQEDISIRTHSMPQKNLVDIGNFIPVKKSGSVANVIIGSASNGFSTLGPKNYMDVNIATNTIVFVHRNNSSVFPSGGSGHLRYDISTDGGTTWSVDQGYIWSPTGATGALNGPARYPQGVIFNPTGNTDPDSAFLAFAAPTLNGTNSAGSWGGWVLGSTQLDGTDLTATEYSSNVTNGRFQVPDDLEFVADSQIVFGVAQYDDLTSGSVVKTDTVVLAKGVLNASNQIQWSFQDVYYPVGIDTATGDRQIASSKIAFSPDGSVGYLGGLSFVDNTSISMYGTYHPTFVKTTDGGQTWSSVGAVDLSTLVITETGQLLIDSLRGFSGWTIDELSTAFDLDMAVDANNNPHMFMSICPAALHTIPTGGSAGTAFSVFSGVNFLVDIYSLDGGSTWKCHVINTAMLFRGEYGASDFSEDNRPQIARTEDGSTIIYAYGDTDTSFFGGTENNFPDVWVRGLDVASDTMGLMRNLTDNLIDKGTAHQFNLPRIIYDANAQGEHLVPVTATAYLDPAVVTTSVDYAYYALMYTFTDSISSINEHETVKGELGSIYPNPANNNINIAYTVKEAGKYSMEISNITGVVLKQADLGNIGTGKFMHTEDIRSLAKGVYVITLRSGESTSSQRLIVQ